MRKLMRTCLALGAIALLASAIPKSKAEDARFTLEGYSGFGKNDTTIVITHLAPGDSARSGWVQVNRCETLTLYSWFTGDTATWKLEHSEDGTHYRQVATGLIDDNSDSTNIDLWEELDHGTANDLGRWDVASVRFTLTCIDTADTLFGIVAGIKCREAN